MKSKSEIVTELANNYPYEEEEIESALVRLEAVSQSLNIPLEVVAEDICRIGSVTRESGMAVGVALRTIYSRLNKQYLEDIGIDTTINTDEVLERLSKHYKGLIDNEQKLELAIKLAGRYNLARLAALLENR